MAQTEQCVAMYEYPCMKVLLASAYLDQSNSMVHLNYQSTPSATACTFTCHTSCPQRRAKLVNAYMLPASWCMQVFEHTLLFS